MQSTKLVKLPPPSAGPQLAGWMAACRQLLEPCSRLADWQSEHWLLAWRSEHWHWPPVLP